jgi:WD40 repeat protein
LALPPNSGTCVERNGLNPAVDRDLATICLKCLEKDPRRRYGSAAALADELERWLRGEPISARAVGRGERAWRWCRRNPMVASLLAVTAAALLAGTILSTYFAVQANDRAREAEDNAATAKTNAEQARQESVRAVQAKQQAERNLYATDMHLALRDWEDGNIGRMVRLLESHRPNGEPDLRGWEWYYLWRLCHQELRTISGPVASISGIKVSADGTLIARGSEGGTVQVWETATGRLLTTLKGYPTFWFAPKGELVTGNAEGTVQFWDPATGRPLRSFTGHKQLVTQVDFTPDGKQLATASDDGILKVWKTATDREPRTLKGTVGRGTLRFSGGGTRLACWWKDKQTTVKVWETATGRELRQRVWRPQPVWFGGIADPASVLNGPVLNGPVFSPDGSRLAVPLDWWLLTLWDVVTGKEVRIETMNPDRGALLRPTFAGGTLGLLGSLQGQGALLVASALSPDRTDCWQLIDQEHFEGGTPDRVVFSPDGARLAISLKYNPAGDSGWFWDVATGRGLGRLNRPPRAGNAAPGLFVDGMIFSPDGSQLVTIDALASKDWAVRVWGVESRSQENLLKGHTSPIQDAVFSAEGTRLILASKDGSVNVWSVSGERLQYLLWGSFDRVRSRVAVTPERILAAGYLGNGQVRVSDLTAGQELFTWKFPKDCHLHDLAFSPGGDRLAALWYYNPENRWVPSTLDVASGKAVHHLPGLPSSFDTWVFSPDCTRLATRVSKRAHSGKESYLLKIWDISRGEELRSLKGAGRVTTMVFRSDGLRLAAGMADGSVQLWDLAGKNEPRTLGGSNPGGTVCLAFSPDGTCLARGGDDGTVRIWEVESGKVLHSLKGHTARVGQVAFHPKGTRLVSVGGETAKVWDLADGHELLTLKVPRGGICLDVLFDRDGWRLVFYNIYEVGDEVQVHDVRPSSEAVQTEREASAVVTALFSRLLTKDEILAQLKGNPTISAAVRQQALTRARRGPVGGKSDRGPEWAVVHSPVGSPALYQKVLNMAEAAAEFPEGTFHLRGMAHYRLGQYKEALATLGQFDNPAFPQLAGSSRTDREVALFFAMALYQDGQKDQARATLVNFRKAVLRAEPGEEALDEADRALLREAEELIEGTPAAPKK